MKAHQFAIVIVSLSILLGNMACRNNHGTKNSIHKVNKDKSTLTNKTSESQPVGEPIPPNAVNTNNNVDSRIEEERTPFDENEDSYPSEKHQAIDEDEGEDPDIEDIPDLTPP